MKTFEDILQERLERLEAGEPVEVCTADLDMEAADLVQFAAALRQVDYPPQSAASIAAQRASLLTAVKPANATTAAAAPVAAEAGLPAWLEALRARLDQLLSQPLVAGAAALAIIVVVALAVLLARPDRDNPELADGGEPAETALVEEGSTTAETTDEVAAETAATETEATAGEAVTTNNGSETTAETGAAADMAGAEAGAGENAVYLPIAAVPLQDDPTLAMVTALSGSVEVSTAEGNWTAVTYQTNLAAGQRLRTGPLSSAKLAFHDGSYADVGPESELSIETLDAKQPEAGFRTIVLIQHVGESEHHVAFRNDGGSRYEVKAPSGSGIARGTIFRVLVTPTLLTRYVVLEGQVDVSNLSHTVSVIAGQLTTFLAGQQPSAPVFRIAGEGEVTQIGATWIVGGQNFGTTDQTIIVGNPQVGDLVRVEGHLAEDGSRLADRIVLIRRALVNRFSLTGEVEAMGAATWTVAGQSIVISDTTAVDAAITTGDTVAVEGLVRPDGTLEATAITLLANTTGLPFHFTGVVQTIGATAWTISGQSVTVDAETAVSDDIAVGDVVAVQGLILENGTWLAHSIEAQAVSAADFTFTGTVESMDPWSVSGIHFETRPWTVVASDVAVGDRVRVTGVITEDGTWVAATVELLEAAEPGVIVIIGPITSLSPVIINGIILPSDVIGQLNGNLVLGSVVRIKVKLQPNGAWRVLNVKYISAPLTVGCFTVSLRIVNVKAKEIVVGNWASPIVLTEKIKIKGNPKKNSVIAALLCTQFGGTVIIDEVAVIYEPIVVIVPAAPSNNDSGNDNGKKKKKNKNGK